MERFLLYLDNLDDWVFGIALLAERLRVTFSRLGLAAMAIGAQLGLIALAIKVPAVGAAAAALLTVTTLYRSATAPIARAA